MKEARTAGIKNKQRCKLVCLQTESKSELIFHGVEAGNTARAREMAGYHKTVKVLFNKEAWASETTLIHWRKHGVQVRFSSYPTR